jgi:DNA-binding NtrC family response regulator
LTPFAEDHNSLRRIFSHSNWTLLSATNTQDALDQLQAGSVTLVLCEDRLRDGSWTDFLAALEQLPSPPVLIVVSRLATDHLWKEAIDRGAFDVLPKPFDMMEVLRTVAAAAGHAWNRVSPAAGMAGAHA